MAKLSLDNRVRSYAEILPNWPPPVVGKGWLYGVFVIGNDYRSKRGFYGEYPPNYLKRMNALFPDAIRVLHLFSGVVQKGMWSVEFTLDRQEALKADLLIDVEDTGWARKAKKIIGGRVDLILADPPYTGEDAAHYGVPLINRKKVVASCHELVVKGGHLVWLDQVFPMYSKMQWDPVGTIGIWRSTNHRFRGLTIFERQ